MKHISMIAALFAMIGCVAPSQWMQGPKGDMRRCATSGWGYIGAPLAIHAEHVCIEDYEKVGYKRVEPQ
jgi:hypothetical protein